MCLIVVCKWSRRFWVTQWTSCFGVKGGLAAVKGVSVDFVV